MSNLSFLSHLGCFIIKDFLSKEFCQQVLQEVQQAKMVPAGIVGNNDSFLLNEDYRKTKIAKISKQTKIEIHNRMLALKPQIEDHFEITLKDAEKPEVLVYREGDFFNLHKDLDDQSDSDAPAGSRKVSIVIFLNDQAPKPQNDCYCGGSLNLYGMVKQPGWENYGFPLGGKAGSLFAFRSDIFHEVTPVTFGERFTIVNWFN